MSFAVGQKDKSPSSSPNDSKSPLEEINDPKRHEELESGGMIVGPNHPSFKEGNERFTHPGFSDELRLPPEGAPHGARFDPIVPYDTPRSGCRSEPIAGPDQDEFLPPGQEPPPSLKQQSRSDSSLFNVNVLGKKGFGRGFGGPPI
ncbi:6473_t:CDS:1 [Acaulospora morrowiae]|uniref:6473_t:CDS:1 n=1 Tax=Acaulospora morrowiae TaxID=94023 RepID=A0A9N9ITA7_9GLOM|nr:6473_t:CDS:1 [Acaulospora morrowiae]